MMSWLEAHWIAVSIYALSLAVLCLSAQNLYFKPRFSEQQANFYEERLQAYKNQLRDMEHAYAVLIQERDHLSEVLRHCVCASDSERLKDSGDVRGVLKETTPLDMDWKSGK